MKRRFTALLLLPLSLGLASCGQQGDAFLPVGDDGNYILRVGMVANYPSFNWAETTADSENNYPIQGQTGQYAAGYDVMIAERICEDNGWTLQIQKMLWDNLVPSVQNNVIDVVIAGMSDTEERRMSIDFTDAYYTSDLVIIARKDDARFSDNFDPNTASGIRFVTQLSTVEDEIAKNWKELYGSVYINPTPDYPTAFLNVSQNLADAVICEYPVAVSMMDAYPTLAMYTVDQSKVDSSFIKQLSVSIGLRKGNTELADKINASLAKIDSSERQELMDAAIERSSTMSGDVE